MNKPRNPPGARAITRRRFLILSGLAPLTSRGPEQSGVVNVRAYGARGDGTTDDTAAMQAAIDALPRGGGTVLVPRGTYRVDATRSVRLRSGTRLQLAPDAVLQAIPNDRQRHYVLLIEDATNVEIHGGRIVGERDGHLGDEGEWGYGVSIRGSEHVTVSDLHVSRCWGDGICVAGLRVPDGSMKYSSDVALARVTCDGNRRQGLTIGAARQVRVSDSAFMRTAGTKPQCGIDIEPDPPTTADDIHITRCVIAQNRGTGIVVYQRVSAVTITDCIVEENGGNGALVVSASDVRLVKNSIRNNGLTGAFVRTGSRRVELTGNTFRNNATQRLRHLLKRMSDSSRVSEDHARDIEITADVEAFAASENTFEE